MTTTNITPVAVPFPYSGMPDIMGQLTGVPRGEVSFFVDNVEVPLTTGGNDQRYNINCILPQGYAYVLRELFMLIHGTNSGNWSDVAIANLQDAETNSLRDNLMPFEMFTNGLLETGSATFARKAYTACQVPKQVLYPAAPQEGIKLEIINANTTVDQAVCNVQFNARFLQFDVEQANHFAVNFPAPVR